MKAARIASENNFDEVAFIDFLKDNGYPVKSTFLGSDLEDSAVTRAVAAFTEKLNAAEKQQKEIKQKKQEEENKKNAALSQILITSGFNFDGYTIKKYSGYISGDDVIQVDRGREGIFANPTAVGPAMSKALINLRRNALTELKEAALDLGCNAVIGVDFDYMTLAPETVNLNGGTLYMPYVFCVTANGNAVIIEQD
ncbi:putative heavy-metal-binding [Bifidobacterium margollesii]|uniref:Putative heavy-metal-binding n=1 Tax=Bifidobacterium margollesii TaxID=2020964 RepID=A0A2N5JBA9_9BIFI|nr:heavy metal-binding domain-containing protein [Bifidobacterium margollesii]PLS31492.1 putative heavy-metal-binding [Bifidobacterium margollesii]